MKKNTLGMGLSLGLCIAGNIILPPPSQAADFICTGSLGAVVVDNLIVPDGASCTLVRTRVNGSVEIGANASLIARGVFVVGNIQGDGAGTVTITQAGPATAPIQSQVGGNIEFQKGAAVTVNQRTRVAGDLIIQENTGLLVVNRNFVTGSVQINNNTGGARINSNTISGNLQCQDNLPAPTGANNLVTGNKEDQCVTF